VAIGFRAATGNKNEATGTDVLLTYPATVASGDAMLLRYSLSGTTVTLVTPSGWTLLAGPIDKGTTNREYLLGRVANGTEAGNTLTISASASSVTKRYAQLAAYSGTDTSPFGTPSSFVETTAGTTHAAPTVNVTTAGCWIVEFAEDRGSPGSTGLTHGTYTLRDTQVGTGGGAMTVAVADSNTTVVRVHHGRRRHLDRHPVHRQRDPVDGGAAAAGHRRPHRPHRHPHHLQPDRPGLERGVRGSDLRRGTQRRHRRLPGHQRLLGHRPAAVNAVLVPGQKRVLA
jgi:hypothetical protein